MNTVIVPIDFSETSLNAARYAGQLLAGHTGIKMILYHVFEKPQEATGSKEYLENLKVELERKDIDIVPLAEQSNDFIDELEKLARHQQADLIIMGITGRSALGQTFLGSNIFKFIEKKVCPVMIVPPGTEYKNMKNVLLTSDFKNSAAATPSAPLKKVLNSFQPRLHVINVDSNHYVALTEEYQTEKLKLSDMLEEFNPEFYFMGWYDVEEAINQFAQDKNIDLIITIPRDHSLIEKMFKGSYTKKLAYHSSVPVLAVHE
ncbi:MAG: universal stress protein [Bacteroidetes bacterium]|nr:universal stress protein [Bacteroidota bacterium]MBS1931839.1 universal stress protein [Bacteroidota bacterium]